MRLCNKTVHQLNIKYTHRNHSIGAYNINCTKHLYYDEHFTRNF